MHQNIPKLNSQKKQATNKSVLIASYVGLFLISLGVSFLVFSIISPNSASKIVSTLAKKSKINLDAPKVAECPISGQKYTQAEADIWKTRRPIAAMIENSMDARPTSGLSSADVVYEVVAEGGITRFLSVFYCGAVATSVQAAPIRSARVYFMTLAAGYGKLPLYLHQGEANNICNTCPGGVKPRSEVDPSVIASSLFAKLGWEGGTKGNNLDGGYNIGFPMIQRKVNRLGPDITLAWEHSVVADLDLIWEDAEKRNLGYKDSKGEAWDSIFKKWTFQDGKANQTPKAPNIKFGFWDNQANYDVEWKYDPATNSYLRFNGGQPFIDFTANKSQIAAKNVVIMFADEKGPLDNEKHMFYQVTGTGKALVFQNGIVTLGTWSKASALDREMFYDNNRQLIPMVRGQTWIEVVPDGNTVSY